MSSSLWTASGLGWDEAFAELQAAARWGAADLETIDATRERLRPGDPNSWLMEWTAAGGALWARPHDRDGAARYLSAGSYYAAALALIDKTDGSVNEGRLWRRQRQCWNLAVQMLGAERLAIPFEHGVLPGYFFSGATAGRRPLIVIDHGGRVATSFAWIQGGAAAHARGYHWLTFDGPGRQAFGQSGVGLRTDWETVLGAVLDMALARSDVDGSRIALLGADHAGLGVTRALVMERRAACAAVLPGIVNASAPLLAALPAPARTALFENDRGCFDSEVRLASLFDPGSTARLRRLTRGHGDPRARLFDAYRRALEFRLDHEVSSIDTPLAIGSQRPDGPWRGQAEQLGTRLPWARQLGEIEIGDDTAIDWLVDQF